MSVETPLWFDATYYAEQKLDQLSLIKWDGKTGWTYSAYLDELAKYDVTPYENFVASNDANNLRLTNLSPNRLFNVNEYLTALADYANKTGYSYAGYKAGEWTAQKAMEHMFNDYHVSAWDHFTLAGQYNLINPSNDFDITAYYDELTAWRNSYVDPKTGAKGWEGRTDWTRLDVIEDNIWNETNPIEGLWGEAADSGIHAQAVPASQRVTVDSNWNPWVEVEASGPVTPSRPGGSGSSSSGSGGGSGGSSSGSDDADDDAWQPDQTVAVKNEAATYAGEDGENTLFVAKDGLNPASVIDGGADSENVLNVNMTGNFAGFDGVNGDPSLTNVQTVNLVNNKAETFSFNGKNTAGVENWNIENGPVNLSELPDDGAAIGLKNITKGGGVSIGFNDAVTKAGDASLILNVDNVGKQVTEVEGDPLNVSANAVSKVTVNSAAGSENLISLDGVKDAKEITVQGAGQVSLADMGDKVETVDASSLKGQFIATLPGENAPATIKGGSGSDDSIILNESGYYDGNWSGIENVVVGGSENGYVGLDGSNVSGLENIIVNRWTPETPADLYVSNLKAETISVEDSSYAPDEDSDGYGRSSWVNLDGEIGDIQYTARKPYDGMDNGSRDVEVTKTAIGTDFRTTAGGNAKISVEEGVSLGGNFYFSQADNVEITGPGQFGNWRWLDVDAPQAKTITAELGGNSSLNMSAVDGVATATVKGDNNYVWANGKTATITDGAGSNTLQMSVRDHGTITGGGGADNFVIDGMTINGNKEPGQPEIITATIVGKDSVDSESFEIQGYNVYTSMAVTIEGYDETDQRINTSNSGFARVDQEQAEELIVRLFGLEAKDLEQVRNEHDEICGYYDAANNTAYGFTWNAEGELNVGVKLTDIDSPELAARAFGYEPYRVEDVRLEPGQLVYTAPMDSDGNPLPTCFWSVVREDSDDSSLVRGVQITGPYTDEYDLDRLVVDMYADFDGLGPDGFMKGFPWLQLYDEDNRYNDVNRHLTFNAENMSGIDMLRLAYAQFTVTNLEQGLSDLEIIDVTSPDATISIDYVDGALDNYDGYLQLSVDGVGSKESPLAPVVAGVTQLQIGSYEGWHVDPELANWLDISNFSEISSLSISCPHDLNLSAQNMSTNENVRIDVNGWTDGGILQGNLDFTNTPFLYFENWYGRTATREEAFALSASKAEDAILDIYSATNLDLKASNASVTLYVDQDSLPEFINLKVDAKSFKSDDTIRSDSADVDLSGVQNQTGSLDFWTRSDLKFQSTAGGSEVNAEAQTAALEGSAKDDTFRVHVSESATVTGGGGDDTFVAYANKGTHAEDEGPVQVQFNGSKAADGHDTFIVNTWQDESNTAANAKLALTVTGYDQGDFLKVTNSQSDADGGESVYVDFAAVEKAQAQSALNAIFGINIDDLANITSSDNYAWYDSSTQSYYGFAQGDNGEIVAAVKLVDVDSDLAATAFAPGAAQA